MSSAVQTTPVMKQFWEAKKKHPDSIMLFRMGDFYETFDKDAILTSEILGIALTKRANGAASAVPLAGFPYHSLEQHLHKLLRAGHRIAICEQVEDPKLAKGIVKREVVEVLSPGTAISDRYLDKNENNFLCSIVLDKENCGFSVLDHSTGEFQTCLRKKSELLTLLKKFSVTEVIIPEDQENELRTILDDTNIFISLIPDWCRNYTTAHDTITSFFNVSSVKGFGIAENPLAISAAACAIYYVDQNYKGRIQHITSLSLMKRDGVMGLDSFTIRNLEIFQSLSNQGVHGTLIKVIDKTVTSSGSRLLKNWIREPLIDKKQINSRLNRVEEFYKDQSLLKNIIDILKEMSDMERILAKIASEKASPIDILNLGITLKKIPVIKEIISKKNKSILVLINSFDNTDSIADSIMDHIHNEPPINTKKGGYIRDGFSNKLDEYRNLANDVSHWMQNMQEEERRNTNIPSLKVGFNKVFGYFIEVTKVHIDKVPENYIRKQTLTNSERYFTEELKCYEEKILSAEEKIISLESRIFQSLQKEILLNAKRIQHNAKIISRLDVASSLASLAILKNYQRPIINNSYDLRIVDGRHPVVEDLLSVGDDFIPNDVSLNRDNLQIAIVTGPNMSGKSTYLRQIGILVIMAQIGSFIPANYAEIGIIDKLFTRVGASDNLAGGESTFLVEMNETANILNNATSKSLILLDEIGRGTSTYDGLSIAWAVTEYIHNHEELQAKTIFATHYHELVSLAKQLPRAINLNVDVKEFGDKIVFLKKIIEGGANKSYGIHVAEMAGIPNTVISRAKELLEKYGQEESSEEIDVSLEVKPQMDLFLQIEKQLINDLNDIDVDNLTPVEALKKLDELKKKYEM